MERRWHTYLNYESKECHWPYYDVVEVENELAAKDAEIARLRKAIAWMLRVSFGIAGKIRGGRLEWWSGKEWHCLDDPGTDEERIATVCRLAGEG